MMVLLTTINDNNYHLYNLTLFRGFGYCVVFLTVIDK